VGTSANSSWVNAIILIVLICTFWSTFLVPHTGLMILDKNDVRKILGALLFVFLFPWVVSCWNRDRWHEEISAN
jgi:hypothetical protein